MAACVGAQVKDRLRTKGVQDPEAASANVKETLLNDVAHL